MDLKATLKAIKLNEPTLSTILGAFVILAVGVMAINYFRSPGKTGTITAPAQTAREETTPKIGAKHKVVSGEHLWGIAEMYYKSGYNWVDIAQANKLANANVISAGMELTIPEVTAKNYTVDTTQQAQASPQSDEPIQTDTYSVAQGDHLWNIAVRAYGDGYQWSKIWEANRASISNPNLIYPDQNLTIPR